MVLEKNSAKETPIHLTEYFYEIFLKYALRYFSSLKAHFEAREFLVCVQPGFKGC